MPMLNNQMVNPKDLNTWAGARGDPVPGATKKGDWSDLDQQKNDLVLIGNHLVRKGNRPQNSFNSG